MCSLTKPKSSFVLTIFWDFIFFSSISCGYTWDNEEANELARARQGRIKAIGAIVDGFGCGIRSLCVTI